jgi:anion-transporting  ArsA/GET3 family ATPase
MGLADVLDQKKIIICCGSGGVGKTSIAAALAIKGAMLGKKTIALTIDPAKRLADSMGLKDMGNEEILVPLERFGVLPEEVPGSLHAMVLDRRGSWDELMIKYAPSEEISRNILKNSFYKNLSYTFAGSQEYLAMEKLYELYFNRKYDLIVVDTPPTKHTVDFLEVPHRMTNFLDRKIVKWFMLPYFSAGRIGLKLLGKTGLFVFQRLEDATGVYVLKDISEFFLNLSSMIDGVNERLRKAAEIIRSNQTAFFLIASPDTPVLTEAKSFLRRAGEFQIPLTAIIINKVNLYLYHEFANYALEEIKALARKALKVEPAIAERLAVNYLNFQLLARADKNRIQTFKQSLPPNQILFYQLPYLEKELQDIKGLLRLNHYLFDESMG